MKIAEIQVAYHPKKHNKPKIESSSNSYEVLMEDWPDIHLKETFYMLLLNRKNRVLGKYKVSEGGISGTVVDLRIMFSIALKGLATAIVIAHNHPSGNLNPSEADLDITKKIKDAGKILDIPLLDHLIVTDESYLSFVDEGIL